MLRQYLVSEPSIQNRCIVIKSLCNTIKNIKNWRPTRLNFNIKIHRVSHKFWPIAFVYIERTKLSRKVFYHFAIFAIVNKILITKNCQILISIINFLLEYHQLYSKTARKKNHLFSSHRIVFSQKSLRIFYQLFNTAFSYFY